MSLERPVALDCPECGHGQTVIVWDSLNADVSPEARAELLEGRINVFLCTACGQRIMLSVPLLYHDMTRKFVVQFYPFEAVNDGAFLDRFDDEGRATTVLKACGVLALDPQGLMGYMARPHLVFRMSELLRYVRFRERLFAAQTRPPLHARFFVAGFLHHQGPRLVATLQVGQELRLVREPDNPHDPRAVAIYWDADRIGYVPRDRNRVIAQRLDEGLPLSCRITAIDPDEGTFDAVEVSVG